MSSQALSGLAAAVLAVSVTAAQQQPPRDTPTPAATGKGVIAGRVLVADAKPATPIRRARVSLTGSVLRVPETTDTDLEGNFRFTGLPAGTYRLMASKPGFVALEAGAVHFGQRAPEIDLKESGSVAIDAALPRGAAIEGRIVDSSGEAVQSLVVSASRFSYSSLGRRTVAVKQTRTDDLGRYRIHSLPAGEYVVEAAPDPRIESAEAAMPAAERPPGRGRTYYPGTPQLHQARLVLLTAGKEIRGTDFTIEAVPLARVSGRVVDSSGAGVKAFGFRMVPVGSSSGMSGGISPDGRFQLGHVPPGDYLMLAAALPDPNAVGLYAAQPITVSGQDVLDITLIVTPGAVIEGQVQVRGDAALPDLSRARVEAIQTEFELPASRPPALPTTVQADGRFTIRGLFGQRIIRLAGLPAGWALESARLADTDITDSAVDFRESNAPRHLVMTITDQTGGITGSVRTKTGQARAYEVLVIPEDEKMRSATSRFIHRAAPFADGTFKVLGVLPGRYRVAAVEFLDEGALFNPDLLRKLAGAGTAVTVSAAATLPVTVDLQVSR